jgi:hypothetical protein
VVVRNIHPSTPIEMIQQDIESKGFKAKHISCVRQRQTGNFLPLHFADLVQKTKKVFEVIIIAYFKVKIEYTPFWIYLNPTDARYMVTPRPISTAALNK